MDDTGTQLVASGQVCSVHVPDFYTKPIAGGDTHGTVIPPSAWAGAGTTDLVIDLMDREIGSAIAMDPTVLFLGTELNDPMGPWPDSSRRLNPIDHDGDGHPGVTSLAVAGPGYSNPRIAILNPDLRADRIFLGLRNIIGLEGVLTDCNQAEGSAQLVINQRAFGCLTPDGDGCSDAQTDLLDGNMPQFEVQSATFSLRGVDSDTTCAEIPNIMP